MRETSIMHAYTIITVHDTTVLIMYRQYTCNKILELMFSRWQLKEFLSLDDLSLGQVGQIHHQQKVSTVTESGAKIRQKNDSYVKNEGIV